MKANKRCNENKTELFPFIVKELIENIDDAHGLFCRVCIGDRALANQDVDLQLLMPCNIQEAAERMFVHVQHDAENCLRNIVKPIDSDVVVIALSAFHTTSRHQELWLEFGVGKHLKYIPIHGIAPSLGPPTSNAHLFFHSFSGCDTTSSFQGKGKTSLREIWKKSAKSVSLPVLAREWKRL